MKKTKSKHGYLETKLSIALDRSVEAAESLHLSDQDLLTLLMQHMHHEQNTNVVQMFGEHTKKMYNPEAGP